MADKLSWDEIKRRYPDEWVMLVDYAFNENEVKGIRLKIRLGGGWGAGEAPAPGALRPLTRPRPFLYFTRSTTSR